jgi:hypothetical protein
MSAKPLNCVDRAYRSKPEGVATAAGGRMVKRHMRSVHREACRPQGSRSPQRQFSPVRRSDTGDDGVNVLEVNTARIAMVRSGRPVGVRSRGMHAVEANLNSGEPIGSRKGMGIQLTGGCAND